MAILKFSASAVAAQIAHARACKTFLPNWNGPVDRPALILIVGNGVHLRSNGIDGTTTRIVTTEQADCVFHDMWPPVPRACGQSFHDMWPHP